MPTRARSPDAAAHEDAARSIARRVTFLGHGLLWAIVSTGVLTIAGMLPGLIVAFSWGAGLAAHGWFAVLGPELRRRWTEAEVARLPGRLAQERRDVESRHARSLEQLSASIAHEIRNPITAAKSLVQQIRDDPAAADSAEYARIALEEIDRVERAVSHLLRYAREEETTLEDVDLAQVIDAALAGLRERATQGGARIEQDVDTGATLRGDREKLRRVVVNLVSNALDALGDGSVREPRVRVSAGRSLAGSEVWLRVVDNGPGIEADRIAEIWSPFHTSKDGGTGLGLAIVRKIVEAHGGSIDVASEVGRGTELVATFPAAERGAT
jgi:two-component system sensor histidine kinase HydH